MARDEPSLELSSWKVRNLARLSSSEWEFGSSNTSMLQILKKLFDNVYLAWFGRKLKLFFGLLQLVGSTRPEVWRLTQQTILP